VVMLEKAVLFTHKFVLSPTQLDIQFSLKVCGFFFGGGRVGGELNNSDVSKVLLL
jgi:hypothetical protein